MVAVQRYHKTPLTADDWAWVCVLGSRYLGFLFHQFALLDLVTTLLTEMGHGEASGLVTLEARTLLCGSQNLCKTFHIC